MKDADKLFEVMSDFGSVPSELSAAHERQAYSTIAAFFDAKGVEIELFHAPAAQRKLDLSDGLRATLARFYKGTSTGVNPAWDFYCRSSNDSNKHTSGSPPDVLKKMKFIEFDYFAYLGASESTTVPQDPENVDTWEARYEELVNPSGGDEKRPAAIFEITDSTDILYKFAQLELRLAAFRVWRTLKSKGNTGIIVDPSDCIELHSVVGWCGLSFGYEQTVNDAKMVLQDRWLPSSCPHIASMVKTGRFVVLCHSHGDCHEEDALGQPAWLTHHPVIPDKPRPFYVWVRRADTSLRFLERDLRVRVSLGDVDGLRQAIKAELGNEYTGRHVNITVYTQGEDGQWASLEDSAQAVMANDAKHPYVFVLPQ